MNNDATNIRIFHRSIISTVLVVISLMLLPVQYVQAELICEPYQPSTNACSDINSDLSADNLNPLTDFEEPCNKHDICYQTLGKSQSRCDTDFRKDMISSCEEKYLRFEAYKKIGTKKIIKTGLYCFALGVPFLCEKTIYEDIYDWVEVVKEFAEKTVELPGYPLCLSAVPVYEGAVRLFGDEFYQELQQDVTEYSVILASNQLSGKCSLYTSADNSQLFSNDSLATTKAIYNNILHREPTQDEFSDAVSLENSYIDWEYYVVSENSKLNTAAILVPIIGLIIN